MASSAHGYSGYGRSNSTCTWRPPVAQGAGSLAGLNLIRAQEEADGDGQTCRALAWLPREGALQSRHLPAATAWFKVRPHGTRMHAASQLCSHVAGRWRGAAGHVQPRAGRGAARVRPWTPGVRTPPCRAQTRRPPALR
jgi:hypothetical protein